MMEDGLLVMGRGMGIRYVLSKFILHYCRDVPPSAAAAGSEVCPPGNDVANPAPSGEPAAKRKRRLVIVINVGGEAELLLDALVEDGLEPRDSPTVITNEFSIKERISLYKRGGVFIVTSRIILVDLLNGTVDGSSISGFLVHHAEKVAEFDQESFILRLYRQKCSCGFVKAFSEEPEALSRGFGSLEKALRTLTVSKLYLWPRFEETVVNELKKATPPELIELEQGLTKPMEEVQGAIVIALDACLKDLKKRVPHMDPVDLSVESGLFSNFYMSIRRQLDPEWHKLDPGTRQLVSDLGTLRQLLDFMFRYDCVTFYSFLQTVRAAATVQNQQGWGGHRRPTSLWLTMPEAARLFDSAKARVYKVEQATPEDPHRLTTVLEQNPKWQLVADLLEEIKKLYKKEAAKAQKEGKPNEPIGGSRVLIMVKDESTAAQLSEMLCLGGEAMMKQRFLRFLTAFSNKEQAKRLIPGGAKPISSTNTNLSAHVRARAAETELLLAETEILKNSLLSTATKSTNGKAAKSGGKGAKGGGRSGSQGRGSRGGGKAPGRGKSPRGGRGRGRGTDKNTTKSGNTNQNTSAANGWKKRKLDIEGDTLDSSLNGGSEVRDAAAGAEALMMFDDIEFSENNVGEEEWTGAEPMETLHAAVYTYTQANERLSILSELEPRAVILYDPDMAFVRSIEVYCATRPADAQPLRVYFAVYQDSAEHQRYLTSVRRERDAFQGLIEKKGNMPAQIFDIDYYGGPMGGGGSDPLPLSLDTRTGARADARRAKARGPLQVVVDVREFRSQLPMLLYFKGIGIAVHTITIGDYVLSPDLCVERKSVSDLYSSFGSGRLWKQAEAMCRHYKRPALLIEFNPDKPFQLQSKTEITHDVKLDSICTKMALLTLSFPSLRILWSRSPHCTVDIFEAITKHEAPVDVEKALSSGEMIDRNTDKEGSRVNLVAQEFLSRLPGVTAGNIGNIMKSVSCVADLATMSQEELEKVMGTKKAARDLQTFFDAPFGAEGV